MNHTAGPWVTYNKDQVINQNSGRRIATCMPDRDWVEQSGESSYDEDKANAALIAAAPEMLEALKKVDDYFSGDCIDGVDEALAEAIRAIINKAEGNNDK